MTLDDEKDELRFIVIPLFMVGFATRSLREKQSALDMIMHFKQSSGMVSVVTPKL